MGRGSEALLLVAGPEAIVGYQPRVCARPGASLANAAMEVLGTSPGGPELPPLQLGICNHQALHLRCTCAATSARPSATQGGTDRTKGVRGGSLLPILRARLPLQSVWYAHR